MSLQITLDGQSEAIVRAQLAQGHANSAEDLIERALTVYSRLNTRRLSLGPSQKTPDEAVQDIRNLRIGITLAGLDVKDLAHEGHKY